MRTAELHGLSVEAYRVAANSHTICLAMVETAAALANVDAILAVPGCDGVFIGPADLSISLSNGAFCDMGHPSVAAAKEKVVAACAKAGKIAGIYCGGGDVAAQNAKLGFKFLAIGADYAFLEEGAKLALSRARASGAGAFKNAYS